MAPWTRYDSMDWTSPCLVCSVIVCGSNNFEPQTITLQYKVLTPANWSCSVLNHFVFFWTYLKIVYHKILMFNCNFPHEHDHVEVSPTLRQSHLGPTFHSVRQSGQHSCVDSLWWHLAFGPSIPLLWDAVTKRSSIYGQSHVTHRMLRITVLDWSGWHNGGQYDGT